MTPVMAARKGMKTDEEKAELKKLEETAIFNAAQMFRDLLINLPFMSSAIQSFLGVNWEAPATKSATLIPRADSLVAMAALQNYVS